MRGNLIEVLQLINEEEMIELKYHHLAICYGSRNSSSMAVTSPKKIDNKTITITIMCVLKPERKRILKINTHTHTHTHTHTI